MDTTTALNPAYCEKTPDAIRRALEARPDWLNRFTQDFMSSAGAFDQDALLGAIERWYPYAVACATPGYLDETDAIMRRINSGDTADMVFYDDQGRAWDIDNNRLPVLDLTPGKCA